MYYSPRVILIVYPSWYSNCQGQVSTVHPHRTMLKSSLNATVTSRDVPFWQNTHPAHSCAKLLPIYKTGFNVTCFFSLLSCSVQLSTIGRLHGIKTGIVISWYLAVSWHHDLSCYIETSSILVSKRRYSRYLSRYRRYRTALLLNYKQDFAQNWLLGQQKDMCGHCILICGLGLE